MCWSFTFRDTEPSPLQDSGHGPAQSAARRQGVCWKLWMILRRNSWPQRVTHSHSDNLNDIDPGANPHSSLEGTPGCRREGGRERWGVREIFRELSPGSGDLARAPAPGPTANAVRGTDPRPPASEIPPEILIPPDFPPCNASREDPVGSTYAHTWHINKRRRRERIP